MGSKTLALFIGFFGCIMSGYAQSPATVLKGYLGVQGGEVYTYKLVFQDSAGNISGHSYTYLHEGKEVKATIAGRINKLDKTLSFQEKEILYNNGFESGTTICLINATLRYKRGDDGREVYAGPISSSDITNVYCGQGTLSFPYAEQLSQLFTEKPAEATAVKPATVKNTKPIRIVYDTARATKALPTATKPNKEPDQITAGTQKIIDWHSDTLVVEIWDGSQVDGDKLSVVYDGKMLVSNYAISKERKRLSYAPLGGGLSELVFTAVHEGNQPPMTAHVCLWDGAKKHELIVYNGAGQRAVVTLRKKQSAE